MAEIADRLREPFETLTGERERIAALLAGLHDLLALIGADERIYLVNNAFLEFFGLEGVSPAGKKLAEVITDANVREFVRQALESREQMTGEVLLLAPDQGKRYYHLTANPALSQSGAFQGIVLSFHDVTLNRRMEKMRRQFADAVSHELKTPLSAIFAVIETLMELEPPDLEQRRRFYRIIEENTSRLNNLINDLLSLSEIEQHKAILEWADYDALEILRELVSEFQPSARRKDIKLLFEPPAGMARLMLRTDRKAMRKAAGNLVDNAIKYTEPGGSVILRAAPAASGDALEVAVQDTGIGIAPKYHDRIFERFYRVDKARSVKSGGTGLGLAIVKHLMESLGGSVSLVSAPGKGSTFTLTFPLQPPEKPPTPEVE